MKYDDFSENNERLDRLFQLYRDACDVPELSPTFMPELWQKIEARQSTSWVFKRVSGWFVAASAAASAVLAIALFAMPSVPASANNIYAETYVDALAADHITEYTLYTEPVHVDKVADYSAGGFVE
jgi:anti-sigma-K factor RskA